MAGDGTNRAGRKALRGLAAVVVFGALVAVLAIAGCRSSNSSTPAVGASTATNSTTGAEITRPDVGFRSRERLDDHYRKHGREFGDISQAEYLRRAQVLRDARVGGDILELVRADGRITRFDRASGAFIAFDPDGIIRTFFRPNDGENYFRRQARR